MNAEIKSLNRFEEAGFDASQSKAVVVGIDDLLVKSMAVFNYRLDAIEHSINHRFSALENSMRFQMIGTVGVIVAILLGFAGLMYTLSR